MIPELVGHHGVVVDLQRLGDVGGDGIDEDVGAAVSFVHGRRQLLDRSLVAYVDHHGVGAVPGGTDALDGVLGPLLVDLGHHHFGASGGEGIRRRPADPTPTAGHDGDLV